MLVETLATRWGYMVWGPDVKSVWFYLGIPCGAET
jgi:hypothetical protein